MARRKKPTSPSSEQAQSQTTPFCDIDLNRWRDYPEIETDSLWLFSGRERSNGHQLDYHGNCVPQILTQLLTRFTRREEIVLDLFLGSGTSAIEAANLGRRAVGVELKADLAQYVRDKLAEQGKAQATQILQGDSSHPWTGKSIDHALAALGEREAQFLFLHPPYADIIRFSDLPQDLSNADGASAFIEQFARVARLGFEKLAAGRFAGLVIGDKYENGRLIPLGFDCMQAMIEAGFICKSIIVKNITGNERGKGRTGNLWRYRALKGGFYIFRHEYVMLFQKPSCAKSARQRKKASMPPEEDSRAETR
ncbi:MAG: RsmD family RNA methyltransferase [Vampirovibrionales bacterium]|nr:RsmD family RNA methyltransferase [Vampirovibrionales bacterium]